MTAPSPRPAVPAKARPPRALRPAWMAAAGLLVVIVVVLLLRRGTPGTPPAPVVSPPWAAAPLSAIGAAACRQCHQDQFRAWTGSHHDLAMQVATPETVLGDFHDAQFDHFGTRTTFFKRDGEFMVRTDGPDGAATEYEIAYTFGVAPLQQYLIPFPGGRYQALSVAWDSRPQEGGGQRWFHLYPSEKIDHDDQLHWTGRYQNWNLMCAECHSTNLRKGYDPATDSYKTTFDEINVACEACHGPGSRHAQWAREARPPYDRDIDHGLQVRLASRWSSAWRLPTPDAHFPVRDTPASAPTINLCAPCHARRLSVVEGAAPGAPLADAHRLSLLSPPLYHADGQQRDEVYTWGSFLQSRMYRQGVTCMDCHEPHSLQLRAQGNALCARCHTPRIFDTSAHHFHQPDSPGARCTACHMPAQKYMVVHDRLDHSFRVPRPDLAAATGAPDACTMCHTDRQSQWAAAAMDSWYTESWRRRPQWGPVLAAGAAQGAKGVPSLLALASDRAMPPLVRATATELVGTYVRPEMLPTLRDLLADTDPGVRIASLGVLDGFDLRARAAAAGASLSDPVRGVRLEAARLLADLPRRELPASLAGAFDQATRELEESLRYNADWPAENVDAGNLALRRGRPEEAIAAYRRALALDPRFTGAYVNLADVYRRLGRDPEGESELRKGLALLPRSADLHHALGLLLVRLGNTPAALVELESAATLAPANARYAYVYAVGLHSSGKVAEALDLLRRTDTSHPFDPEILGALISILRDRDAPGDRAEALRYATSLAEALPADPAVQQLVKELSAH